MADAVNEYPVIHSVNTHVLKYGTLDPDSADKRQKLLVVIPGNPGAIEFYDEFMKHLHRLSGWPVWGLSHAGHSIVPKSVTWNRPDSHVFTVEGQIQHKVYFINEYIPENTQVILIGHSVGAYVVLEIMNRVDPDKILQGFLLFPAIERMAISPQGKRLTPMLKYMRWWLILLSAGFHIMPHSWKTGLVDYVFNKRKHVFRGDIPGCIKSAALNLFNPFCVDKTTYMAKIEMEKVVNLDVETMERHSNKLRFYYGATDHWCPKQYYYDMKELLPDHQHIYLCDQGIRHAFIIDSSQPMADIINRWLQSL